MGVLIEVNCETDFVARTTSSRSWSATSPSRSPGSPRTYVDDRPHPREAVAEKQAALLADESVQAKPEAIRAKIVEGQLAQW